MGVAAGDRRRGPRRGLGAPVGPDRNGRPRRGEGAAQGGTRRGQRRPPGREGRAARRPHRRGASIGRLRGRDRPAQGGAAGRAPHRYRPWQHRADPCRAGGGGRGRFLPPAVAPGASSPVPAVCPACPVCRLVEGDELELDVGGAVFKTNLGNVAVVAVGTILRYPGGMGPPEPLGTKPIDLDVKIPEQAAAPGVGFRAARRRRRWSRRRWVDSWAGRSNAVGPAPLRRGGVVGGGWRGRTERRRWRVLVGAVPVRATDRRGSAAWPSSWRRCCRARSGGPALPS